MASPSYLNGIIWADANACFAGLMPIGTFLFFGETASPEMIDSGRAGCGRQAVLA